MSATEALAGARVSNAFLGPILARWRAQPHALIGIFHDGDDWHELSHASFMHRALAFSALFLDAGVPLGGIVLIVLEHGVDAHAAFLGAMLAGAVPGFMPSPKVKQEANLYWRQHREVFAHCRPHAILVYDALYSAVAAAAAGTEATVLASSGVDTLSPADLLSLPDDDAIALLQHSSGTTGLKKGVKLSYRAIAGQLAAYVQALRLDHVERPRIASWLPLYHDMGLISSFLMPIWLGIPIVSIDPFEWTRQPSLWFEAIQDFRATHTWVPNFALLHHVRSARSNRVWDLSALRAVICCSEPNKPTAFDSFLDRFSSWGVTESTLQTCYAMAETVFAATQSAPGAAIRRLTVDRVALQSEAVAKPAAPGGEATVLLSNGKPIAGCDIRILRDSTFVGERVVGEVCIAAPYLFSGYHNNQEATQRAFHDGWFRTGDLGLLDGGEVFIVGRLKDVIIVNGKNIVAHDVEAVVSQVPHVKPGRAVAFGHYQDTLGSEQLVVVAEVMEGSIDSATVISQINHLVSQEVGISASDIRLVNQGWLVKTTSGKLSRSENKKKYEVDFICSTPPEKTATAT
jgi:acyl-CoA synthetase (AMP-forming)/AMP-acid ligase II